MAFISGKDGTLFVDDVEVLPITNWTIECTCAGKSYTANDTSGFKRRVVGVRDSRGSFELKLDTERNMPVCEGDNVTLELHIDDSNNNFYSLAAIVQKINLDVDIDTGTVVACIVTFFGNGPVTAPAGLGSSGT